MIKLKQQIIFTGVQLDELIERCGDSPNIIKTRSPGLLLISDITNDWNLCLSINQKDGWVRMDGECSTKCHLLDSGLIRVLCNVSEEFNMLSKTITASDITEDVLNNAVIPCVFVPSSKAALVDSLRNELLFQARIVESKTKEDDAVIQTMLSYTGGADAFFIIKPNNKRIKVLPAQTGSTNGIIKKVCDEITSYTNSVPVPANETPVYIQNEIHKHSLDHKDQQVNNDLDHIVNENDKLKEEVKKLKLENAKLSACVNTTDKRPLLYYGKENDLYDGEIKDFVLEIIKDQMERGGVSNENHRYRRYDVLKDIFEANGYTGSHDERRKVLKNTLIGYRNMTMATKVALEEIGFTIEHYKHCKVKFGGDSRYESVLPSTGSDSRLWKNAFTVIKNICF